MKISKVKTWLVEGIKYNWVLVKVYTDEGITGIGEATNWPGSPIVFHTCQYVGETILGEDATRIDYIWTKLYRDMYWIGQAGPLLSAISAIDIALLEIAGKRAGMPVYELLGGAYRKRIQLYADYWFLSGEGKPEEYSEQVRAMKARGFTACKLDPFAHVNYSYGEDLSENLSLTANQKRLAIARLLAVQEALGPDFPIAVETHAMLNKPTAVEMAHRIQEAKINCLWYEEPAGPEFPDAIAEIKRQISLPVGVGERLHSRFMCRPILERHAADILMPDITRCGGISEMRKIANLCECFSIPVAPHNPNGPISTVASAHVMASIPNFLLQDCMMMDVPWRDTVLDKPLPIRDGFFCLGNEPGLGFDLIEEEVERHPGILVAKSGFTSETDGMEWVSWNKSGAIPKMEWKNDTELFQLMGEGLYTAIVGDVLDRRGLHHQFLTPRCQPLDPQMILVGRAMTVLEADVFHESAPPFGLMLEALDSLQPDEVYVAAGCSVRYALWGELMSTAARVRGATGAVLAGFTRDTNGILAMKFPVFCYGRYAQDQRGRGASHRIPRSVGS